MKNKYFYPLTSSTWNQDEIIAIKKTLSSGYLTYGPKIKKFESLFARYFNSKYGVMVNSGSSANLIALASLFFKQKFSLRPGDEVIVPAISWATTYSPLQQYGLKLKLIDVDIKTLNVDVNLLKAAITKKTKLIVAVSILGNPCDLDEIRKICNKKKIFLIEDNCESMGAKINERFTGTYGDLGTFSFFYSHHISTIEGGMVLTNDKELYNLCLSLRSHGWTRDFEKNFKYKKIFTKKFENYNFILPGYNVRSTEINAAAGIEQLKKLKKFIKIRRDNHKIYQSLFKNDKDFFIQKEFGKTSSFAFTFVFKPNSKINRNRFYNLLDKNKIQYRLITGGCFTNHPVAKLYNFKVFKNLKNAKYVHQNGFFVGNHPENLENKIKFLKEIIDESRK